eukprot:sb/3465177/
MPTVPADWLVARDDTTVFSSKVGESVTLAVDVHLPITLPSRNFKWEKRRERDGLLAKKFDISDDGTSLTINDLTLSDEGGYRVRVCVDNSNCGSIEFSLSVTQNVLVPVNAHQTVTELESVTFEVEVFVEPQPEWQHLMWMSESDGDMLPPKSGRVKAGNSRRTITISSITKEDEGRYQCRLTLEDGSVYTADFKLTVKKSNEVILSPVESPVTALHSSTVTLAVKTTIANVPPNSFTWIRNDKYINPDNGANKYRFANYRKGLVIKDVTAADEGEYTAQMMYGKIHERAVVRLIVNSAEVKIVAENSPLKTVINQNAHFLVSITSSTGSVPWKTINWYKLNGAGKRVKKLTPPDNVKYATPNYRRKLTIRNVQLADQGLYEVEVSHQGVKVSEKVQLIVLESTFQSSREE